MQSPSQRHNPMVFPRNYIQSVEIYWLLFVGTRKTCVNLGLHHAAIPNHLSFLQRGQEKVLFGSPFDPFTFVRMTLLFQFLNYTRYYGLARFWGGLDGLFLF